MTSNVDEIRRIHRSDFLYFLLVLFADWTTGLKDSQKCGVPLPLGKIVGGVDSGGYRYPWFALLLLKQHSHTPTPICGGSLITKEYVLTAAHCFTIDLQTQYQDLFTVALGVYDICDEKETTRQIFNVIEVTVHEKYQKNGKFYDIALIKLDRPADYTTICLPLSGVPDVTEPAFLIGFGVTDEHSYSSPCHMMEVNVTKYSKLDCSNTKLPSEDKKEPSVICAGALNGRVDSCYGDSGGPLQTKISDHRFVITGIVSYGYGCAVRELPGIYTNVGSYLQWISDKLSNGGSKKHFTNRPNRTNLFTQRRGGTNRKPQPHVIFPDGKISYNSSQSTTAMTQISYHWMKKTDQRDRLHAKGAIFEQGHQEERHLGNLQKKSKVTFPQN